MMPHGRASLDRRWSASIGVWICNWWAMLQWFWVLERPQSARLHLPNHQTVRLAFRFAVPKRCWSSKGAKTIAKNWRLQSLSIAFDRLSISKRKPFSARKGAFSLKFFQAPKKAPEKRSKSQPAACFGWAFSCCPNSLSYYRDKYWPLFIATEECAAIFAHCCCSTAIRFQ